MTVRNIHIIIFSSKGDTMFHTVQLSKSDPTPLYIQLASEIARLIQSDVFPGGFKLPSIRGLSRQLTINRDTVVSAYKLLENQGLVESYVGKGTYVVLKETPQLPAEASKELTNIYCSTLGFSKDLFPTSLCINLAHTLISEEGWGAFSDPLFRERNLLKQNACCFLEGAGIKANAAQLHVVKQYTDFLLSLFKFSSKKGICTEAFSDLTYSSYLRSIGAKIHEIPINQEGLDLDKLEKQLRSGTIGYIFLSTYLQNPTGVCYSESVKIKLIELAHTYDCYIIEDGTLSDFFCGSESIRPLFNHFSKERVIYVYHFSKVYLPYLRYSFVLLPTSMIKSMPDETSCSFNEYLLRYYLQSSFLKANQKWMLDSCSEKYTKLYLGLSSLKDKVALYSSHGGLFFWIKPLRLSCQEVCSLFIQHNIIVSPGSLFTYSGKTDYFRLSTPHLTLKHVDEIINLVELSF